MWNYLRSLFGWKSPSQHSAEFDNVRGEVEHLLQLELSSVQAQELHGELVLATLRKLNAAIDRVLEQANNYPANPISALVWLDGAGYAELARELTRHFRQAGWLKREENASGLWAKATLAVCSHYHHLVGPAMIAYADCHDRLGDDSRATELFSSVVRDFADLVDHQANETSAPDNDERVAIESLQTATERLFSRGVHNVDDIQLPQLQSSIAAILDRS